jgi:hypothetical protein
MFLLDFFKIVLSSNGINLCFPPGSSDHCGLEFAFKCYYELKENKSERWNYFKGDYDNMKNELNQDWDNLLNGKSTSLLYFSSDIPDFVLFEFGIARMFSHFLLSPDLLHICLSLSDQSLSLVSHFNIFLVFLAILECQIAEKKGISLLYSRKGTSQTGQLNKCHLQINGEISQSNNSKPYDKQRTNTSSLPLINQHMFLKCLIVIRWR